jgi:hypothetical protein
MLLQITQISINYACLDTILAAFYAINESFKVPQTNGEGQGQYPLKEILSVQPHKGLIYLFNAESRDVVVRGLSYL